MYFTVEEENLICLYHNADRRRTAANLRAALLYNATRFNRGAIRKHEKTQ